MSISQKRSLRKVTGGRYRPSESKKLATMGSLPSLTKLAETKLRKKKNRGGARKSSLLSVNKVNVLNQKTKKSELTEISSVTGNQANRNFVRRGILTKGAVVTTPLGKARITSRPGQVGTLNAVLIE